MCSHGVHKRKEELPTVCCVCRNIWFVCVCVLVWSGSVQLPGVGGWRWVSGCTPYSEGGMDINHQEEHASVAPGGDGWGVSAVMSP